MFPSTEKLHCVVSCWGESAKVGRTCKVGQVVNLRGHKFEQLVSYIGVNQQKSDGHGKSDKCLFQTF